MLAGIGKFFTRPQVLLHGRYSPWMKALGPGSAIWAKVGDYEVGRSYRLGLLPTWRRRFVIPMVSRSFRTMPLPAFALVPSREALAVFSDKHRFARYAQLRGLAGHVPATWTPGQAPGGLASFPLVLKRVNLSGNRGIAIVRDSDELADRLRHPDWSGHQIIVQEYIEGATEETLHVVCATGGRIVWHLAHVHQIDASVSMRAVPDATRPQRGRVSAADLALFERFLRPIGYEGPACIDFKRRPDGRIAVFEINPRFGASLMRPEFEAERAEAVATILAHARWHAAGMNDFSYPPQ